MKHAHQSGNGSCCGHACLAMLTGFDVDRVIRDLGHTKDGLSTSEIAGYLGQHGWRVVGDRFGRARQGEDPPVPLALCQVSWYDPWGLWYNRSLIPGYKRDTNYRHLVVWAEGRYWDPANSNVRTRDGIERAINPGVEGLMTSYLEVRRQ